MKGRFKSLGLLVLSVVLSCWLVGAAQPTPEVTLETSPTLTTAQKTWFRIGYAYAEATEEDDITELGDMLPGVPPWELLQALSEWKDDPEDQDLKGKVRPLLATYAKDQADYLGVEAFRLGEWCSQMEDALVDFVIGLLTKNEMSIFDSVIRLRILSEELRLHIDILSSEAPDDVMGALKEIHLNAAKLDIVKIATEPGPIEERIEEFLDAIMSLPELIDKIKEIFEV